MDGCADLQRLATFWLELVVNLRTARELAIKVPQSIPVRADRIIE